jgi:hypothetical protein
MTFDGSTMGYSVVAKVATTVVAAVALQMEWVV